MVTKNNDMDKKDPELETIETKRKNEDCRDKIVRAYKRLIKNDSYLLENNACERSITHHLALYIQDEFPEYHVDCEYNRKGVVPKTLNRRVYPDIIVHKRGVNNRNYIVIEAKKTSHKKSHKSKSRDCRCDKCKLKAYINDQELNYKYAFFVLFPTNSKKITFEEQFVEQIKKRE